MALPDVRVRVTADTDDFVRGVDRAESSVDGLGTSANNTRTRAQRLGTALRAAGKAATVFVAAAGAVTVGASRLVSNVTAEGDEIAKTARRLGVGAEALQELQFAAERSGVAQNTLSMALQRMTRRVSEAAQGSGQAKDAIAEMGLSAEELGKMTPEKQLGVFADALSEVENSGDRTRLAMRLFDSEGVQLLNMLDDGSDGLNAYAEEARALGGIMSDELVGGSEKFQDQMTNLRQAFSGLGNELAEKLIPVLVDDLIPVLVDHIIPAIAALIPVIAEIVTAFAQLVQAVAPLVEAFWNLGTRIVDGFVNGIRERFEAVRDAITSPFRDFRDGVKDLFSIRSPSRVFMEFGANIMQGFQNGLESGTSGALGVLDTLQSGMQSAMGQIFENNKAFAIAEAIVNTYKGITQALGSAPFPANLAAAATVAAQGFAAVQQIQNTNKNTRSVSGVGATGGGAAPASTSQAAVINLQGDVFGRQQIIGLIEAINEASEDGARVRVA